MCMYVYMYTHILRFLLCNMHGQQKLATPRGAPLGPGCLRRLESRRYEQSWSNLHHSEFPSLCDITMSFPPFREWGQLRLKVHWQGSSLIVNINVSGLRCSFCS